MPALLAAAALIPTPGHAAVPGGRLELTLAGVRNGKGSLRVCLTRDPRSFPACSTGSAFMTRSVPATVRSVAFDDVPYGDYAVAVIHDENGNARLDTFAGIPREGYGFSCDAPVRFGPPSFKAAHFTISTPVAVQSIRLRYLL